MVDKCYGRVCHSIPPFTLLYELDPYRGQCKSSQSKLNINTKELTLAFKFDSGEFLVGMFVVNFPFAPGECIIFFQQGGSTFASLVI